MNKAQTLVCESDSPRNIALPLIASKFQIQYPDQMAQLKS
jgi:hypothetical protein